MSCLHRWRRPLSALAMLVILALAVLFIHGFTQRVRPHQIAAALHALSWGQKLAALGFTAGSYLLLTFYDVVALRIIRRPLPYRITAIAAFVSYALSHNIGFSALTGGSVRLRIYGGFGLSAADVARVVTIAGIAFWFGVALLFGYGLTSGPVSLQIGSWAVPAAAQRLIGLLALLLPASWFVLSLARIRTVRLGHLSLPLPSPGLALAQMLVSVIDVSLAAAALYMLLPDGANIGFPTLVTAFAVAIVTALLAHVPGGLGVFEAMMLVALPQVDQTALLSSLLAFRITYYIIPLILGSLLFLAREGMNLRWRKAFTASRPAAGNLVEFLAPIFAAGLAFLAGAVLLLSAALPAAAGRLSALRLLLPLPFIELSHFISSLVGSALILFAPALYRRLDGAYLMIRLLLVVGIVASLAKGFDWEEALLLLVVLGMIIWARPAFYRRTRLASEPLSLHWLAAGAGTAFIITVIGFFTYKHVPYDDSLWWTFTLHGNAPRFLRALLALGLTVVIFFTWHGFAPAPAAAGDPLPAQLRDRAMAMTRRSDMWLAMTGDKSFLVSSEGDAFLMYRVEGRSWIAMGDPVGAREHWPDLVWRLRDLADRNQGRVLFYQLSAEALPLAIDLGLNIVKYGEEAIVDLNAFSLQGPGARNMRNACRRAEREGLRFQVIPADQVAMHIDALRTVSDIWLHQKKGREKCFSIGHFDPGYLSLTPMAMIVDDNGILAFANIWTTAMHDEFSVDLMRHLPDAPNGVMDYLFVQLFAWGKGQGYRHFNLGLSPLSGLEARRLAPLWARLGDFLFRHGEELYSFEGMRSYKSKFATFWQPRYVAGPQGLPMARALTDLVRMISR